MLMPTVIITVIVFEEITEMMRPPPPHIPVPPFLLSLRLLLPPATMVAIGPPGGRSAHKILPPHIMMKISEVERIKERKMNINLYCHHHYRRSVVPNASKRFAP